MADRMKRGCLAGKMAWKAKRRQMQACRAGTNTEAEAVKKKGMTAQEAACMGLTVLAMLMVGVWRTDIAKGQLMVIRPALLVLGCAGMAAILLGLRWATRRGWTAEKVFLLLFVPLSLAMMVALPIWRAPDETAHLQRAWQISLGNWFPDEEVGGVFYEPQNFFDGVRHSTDIRLYNVIAKWDSQMDMEHLVESDLKANTGIYPISNYFPQALGMAIVRLFTGSRMAIFYGARLAAWAVTLFLFYKAIKWMPVGKMVMIAITLMPMMLQEAVSASADGMTCAANMALAAFVADACVHPRAFTWKRKLLLFALMALVGTLKMLYIPMIFLCFAIPDSCFGGKRRKYAQTTAMTLAIIAVAAAWMVFCNMNYVGADTDRGGPMREQLLWIASNPLGLLTVLGRTALTQFGWYMETMIGKDLAWLDLKLPMLVYWALVLILLYTVSQDDGIAQTGESIRALRRSGLLLSGLCVLVVWMSLLIWETPCGSETVIGVQGRYFIPILPTLYLSLKHGVGAQPEKRLSALRATACAVVCALGFVLIQTIV